MYAVDIFSWGKGLVSSFGSLASLAAFVVLGVMALVEVGRGKHQAALVLLVVAIIPLAFLLDPGGVKQLYQNTVQGH
jgi:hypothetical protein